MSQGGPFLQRLARGAAALLVGLAGAVASAAETPVAVRVPEAPELPWRGLAPAEVAGPGGQILYPAPGLAGFLAAVFTHGAIVQGTRSAERTKQQEAADKVLDPYRPALLAWTPRALSDAAAGRLKSWRVRVIEGSALPEAEEWLVEMAPSFAMSPDQTTLVLDNVMRVSRVSPAGGPRFENTVRVLSTPLKAEEAAARWAGDEARALKDETAAMVAHSVEVALAQLAPAVAGAEEPPQRTHRYLLGAEVKMERSQRVGGNCGRAVLRTLRGTLMSVATVLADDAPACERSYALPVASR